MARNFAKEKKLSKNMCVDIFLFYNLFNDVHDNLICVLIDFYFNDVHDNLIYLMMSNRLLQCPVVSSSSSRNQSSVEPFLTLK
jgi:hypothetical protein